MAKKSTSSESKPKTIGPFDIIGYIFSNQEEFKKLPDNILEKNYFIINDRFSINFPMQAAVFNHYKINGAMVVKCWAKFIQRFNYNRTPSWMFIKGKAKTAEIKKSDNNLTKSEIRQYADHMDVSVKDVEFALELYPEQTLKEIKDYLKYLEDLEKLKKASLSSLKETEKDDEMILDTENTEAIF